MAVGGRARRGTGDPIGRDRQPTLLCLRALGLGDLLTAVPALRALAAGFPAHRRLLATPEALAPIVELLEERWQIVDVRGLEQRLPATTSDADVAVNLHGRGPLSHRVLLASRPHRMIAFASPAAGFPRRAATRRNGTDCDALAAPRWRAGEHEVERWCRLLTEGRIAADPANLRLRPPALGGIGPRERAVITGAGAPGRVTVVHPGAAFAARRWPAARFATVARHAARGGDPVVITGASHERRLADAVRDEAGLPESANLAGRTSLGRLAALVAVARRVVCGDTGVGHLATAFATPSVLLFGPTSPAEWGPLIDRDLHRVLWAGRRGDPHAGAADPGLLEIAVADVLAALDSLPSGDVFASARRESVLT